ncbi:MAG: hypothetical protein NTW86_13515 [Candidatus Sumerlaeota bacterium]|nr:hypothetical protein [Candidatus Sumerlaeota bacterium]
MTDKIAEVETKYQTNQYEETAKELRDMEARLEELLVNTPAVLERAVAEQTARRQAYLDGPIDLRIYAGQQLDESEKELSYAKMDFGKGQYRQSYTNLRQAMRLLDEVQGILETSQYNAQVAQMFDDFTQAQDNFRSILSISETALVDLAVNNPDGKAMALAVSGDTGPGLFRDAVEKIYTQAKALKPPPSKATTHDQVLQLFLMARRAAMNFEKLTILDQFDKKTAREIIEQGFDQLKAARRQQQEIEKTFREPGVDSMIVRTRKAIGVQLY